MIIVTIVLRNKYDVKLSPLKGRIRETRENKKKQRRDYKRNRNTLEKKKEKEKKIPRTQEQRQKQKDIAAKSENIDDSGKMI